MGETSVFVFTQAAGIVKVVLHEKVAKTYACITAKKIMDVYQSRPFYITIANFGKIDVHLAKHEKFRRLKDAPDEVVHIKDECFSTPLLHMRIAVTGQQLLYFTRQLRPPRLDCKPRSREKKDHVKVEKDWRDDAQLPRKFMTHRQAFLEMHEALQSTRDVHLGPINLFKDQTGLLNEEGRPEHSNSYRAGLIARPYAAAQIIRMLARKVPETATTESAVSIMLAHKRTVPCDFASRNIC